MQQPILQVGLPRLFVGWLAIQGSWKAVLLLVPSSERKSTNLTHVTSVCAK